MASGERINFFRNLRGMTQKYLGLMLGFPDNSADVRLAQYESEDRTPKADLTAQLAEALDVSVSTVSRAVKDKYIQCVQGVFPMSHFFGRALPAGSEGVSSEQVKNAIRALIDGEDKKKPLSDQTLCQLLAAKGFVLSRRTVAKYRDEMGIPSTAGRKEF